MWQAFAKVLRDQRDLLLFRRFKPDLPDQAPLYLAWGLFTTWLVGIGRYWDHPSAALWQYLGLGSVAYVFVLAAILWVLILPLRPAHWSYRNVLIFVTLTALPALLYAIPVEKFTARDTAASLNALFLAIVAAWRVGLLYRYLTTSAALDRITAVIACLLPLALIVTVLSILNLERAVFEIMGGLRQPTQYDVSYGVVVLLTVLSMLASPFLLALYAWRYAKRRDAAETAAADAARASDPPKPT